MTCDNIVTFAKSIYIDTVRYMYRDLVNVTVLEMDDVDVVNYIRDKDDVMCIGYMGKDWHSLYEVNIDTIKLDWMFYHQANIQLDVKWDSFYVEREMDREMELFNRFKNIYGIEEGKYVFYHDTSKRAYDGFSRGAVGGEIDFRYIDNKTLPIIRPEDVKFNMFDYRYLLENAAELHMINSSFFNLTELIHTNGKLFYHVYPRPYDCLTCRKPWIKLMEPKND